MRANFKLLPLWSLTKKRPFELLFPLIFSVVTIITLEVSSMSRGRSLELRESQKSTNLFSFKTFYTTLCSLKPLLPNNMHEPLSIIFCKISLVFWHASNRTSNKVIRYSKPIFVLCWNLFLKGNKFFVFFFKINLPLKKRSLCLKKMFVTPSHCV